MIKSNQKGVFDYRRYPEPEMKKRARLFHKQMSRRRSVRRFSDHPVPKEVIEACIAAAGTAPSGANMQPWYFVAVSDPLIKKTVRREAEKVEYEFYKKRAPKQWLDALSALKTDAQKPFLEEAPYLIAIFEKRYGTGPDGETIKHYYVKESVGIATGMLITAVHNAGLVCLSYTPSPMGFLNRVLERPKNERPFLILPVGYPADDVEVPVICKKELKEIARFI